MNRRDFIRQGSLWAAGALVVEPVLKRLWAFPTNPVRSLDYNQWPLGLIDCLEPPWIPAGLAVGQAIARRR